MSTVPNASDKLWQIRSSGYLDDYESILTNGSTSCSDDPAKINLWRYGSWIPDVTCTLVGTHLVVTGRVKAELAGTAASFHRVRSVFVSDHVVDWRRWQDFETDLASLLTRHGINEPEEICCPYVSGESPDPTQPLDRVRKGLVELRDADLWVVFGQNSLEAQRTPPIRCAGRKGAGIYQNPLLYRSRVCVEDRVREILERCGALDAIEFEEIGVEWL